MSDFKKAMDDKLASSSQHQQDIIIIIIIKKMWTLQTLFLSLKIAIFWRIAPSCSFLTEYKMRAPEKNVPCKRCFPLWKSPFSDASPPAVHFFLNIKRELLKNILYPANVISLCENRYFLMHRPQLFIAGFPCRTKFVRYGIAPIAHFLQNY